jgi:hypothetical protein
MTQTDTPELVRRDQPLDLAETPIGQFQPLDLHTEGWTKPVERLEALATISAGYKTTSQKGFEIPARTRPEDERQIHLHDPLGRAPGLAAALEATGYRSLMIAFGHDDPRLFLQQSFRIYTTSALVAYGDASGMTEIFTREETQQRTDRKTGEIRNVTAAVADHVTYGPKTERFAAIAKAAKVYSSLYFYLASWTPEGPRVIFPDGVGCYRLRTTSRNSVEAIVAQLKELARYSQGQLAGIPFELSLTHREAADPFGKKQTIPVWSIVPKGAARRDADLADVQPGGRQGARAGAPAHAAGAAARDDRRCRLRRARGRVSRRARGRACRPARADRRGIGADRRGRAMRPDVLVVGMVRRCEAFTAGRCRGAG